MSFNAPVATQDRPDPVPEGSHIAILTDIIDLGTHRKFNKFKNADVDTREVLLTFELPNEKIDYEKDGITTTGNRILSRTFTLSMGEKANLRKFLVGIAGKMSDDEAGAFDLFSLLGKVCLINVVHVTPKDITYANIESAMPLPKGTAAPVGERPHTRLAFAGGYWSNDLFNQLPNWIQEKVKSADEYGYFAGEAPSITKDDMPFEYPENNLGETKF